MQSSMATSLLPDVCWFVRVPELSLRTIADQTSFDPRWATDATALFQLATTKFGEDLVMSRTLIRLVTMRASFVRNGKKDETRTHALTSRSAFEM